MGENSLFPTQINEFIKNLTQESFMEFIMKINKDLRRDDDEEIISEGVIAGELVATTKSVRIFKTRT